MHTILGIPTRRFSPVFLTLLFVVGGCQGDAGQRDADAGEQVDASATRDADDVDPGLDTGASDVSASDAGPSRDAGQFGCTLLDVEIADGSSFVGQLIASYDHRFWWWDQADRTSLAFFREPAFDSYPDDRSFRIVPMSDITRMSETDPDERRCYSEFRRARGLNVERLPLDGTSKILMGNSGYHRYEGGMGDFAWDFTRVDDTGARYQNDGAAVEDYLVWDEPVYAPVSGYVVDVVRDAPDNTPGGYPDDAVNNMVGIHLGGAYYLYLLHFRQGSIPQEVQPDTRVEAGQLLGRVGNSGVALEPHLHVTLLWHDATATEPRSWSVPSDFARIEVAPTPRGPFETREHVVPHTGQSVRPIP